ncbi:MAG TPA: DUF1549 and DUF1553 domain-containing protein, partial [Gemmata sp.]|nr:DUF1549 and DUF1553 domain-containing protein [Gemmata sp.]
LLLAVVLLPAARAADVPDTWAYKRYTRPAVPAGDAANPIDRFLLAKLRTKGLTFAPEADRRTLIRRVYFDLIGLPPTPEEIDAFLNDKSADAYEKVVDRLLASPRFGERQAEWWLDVVRYAESDGFNSDGFRPNAWRYRDYVIKSFNADKPFDRFVKEQLAGDELYPNDSDAVVATGFLRHFPDEYNAVNLEQRRQEILNDITDTTAAAFLGLTVGCAKCHDHKTDPVPQEDYYRLQAFFAGMKPVEVPLVPPGKKAEYETALAAWEEKTADVRAAIAKLEAPHHAAESKRQRMRFPKEYADLLDVAPEKLTPLEQQIRAMIAKQVYANGDVSAKLKGADKEQWTALKAKLAELSKDRPADPPVAMAMTDLPTPPATKLLKRGNWRVPAKEELDPGFVSVITDADAAIKPTENTPGRRAALANWIASADNPLTARVIANRLWQHHFGKGIVVSSGDFGVTGDRPTHPELMDWLASELTAKGWSLKHLHRLMVTSAAYKQSAKGDAGADLDPDNALLWRFPGRRLDGEALRDAMLAVSGRLNLKAGGPSVFPEIPPELKAAGTPWKVTADAKERDRRSVYVFVKRNLRYPLFALFDAPDRNETCSRRFVTTTAPQALTLLNDPLVLGFAKSFAARVTKEAGTDPAKVIDRAYLLALGRAPKPAERDTMLAFLKDHPGTTDDAATDLCHTLLNLNEFLYVD